MKNCNIKKIKAAELEKEYQTDRGSQLLCHDRRATFACFPMPIKDAIEAKAVVIIRVQKRHSSKRVFHFSSSPTGNAHTEPAQRVVSPVASPTIVRYNERLGANDGRS